MMGFGLPDDNLHAPNEKFNLKNFALGIESLIRFYGGSRQLSMADLSVPEDIRRTGMLREQRIR